MNHTDLKTTIEAAWERRDTLNSVTTGAVREAVEEALNLLDKGQVRVATKEPQGWQIHPWLKQAILLSFRLNDSEVVAGGPGGSAWYDKVPLKTAGWVEKDYKQAGFRHVPGAIVRHGAYVAPSVVLMPSFVNIGAYIDSGTMIDSMTTVASCVQIGKHCHISSNSMLGGVIEPVQAAPVIIEDNCFIGAGVQIAEGVVVETGSVISMGVSIGASVKIIDRTSGEMFENRIPAYSVVVPGSLPGKVLPDGSPGPSVYCAVIVKRVDEQTRVKTSINELLRD